MSQSSKCKRTRGGLTLIGTSGLGFMVSLDLYLSNYGGDYVMNDKTKHNCHALMITSMAATCPKTPS